MYKYCNNTWQWVVEALESNKDKGLMEMEIEERRNRYRSNKINIAKNKIIVTSLKEILRWYVIFSVILSIMLFANDFNGYGISLGLLTLGTLSVKLYINYTNVNKLSKLQGLNNAKVRVLRDGIEKLILAEELVYGDIVYFSKNSLISADLRIISSNNLKVVEKNLTGEEFSKEKFESKIEGSIRNIGDMKNILLRGSVVKDGDGVGIVVATGNQTELGRILLFLNSSTSKKDYLKDAERRVSLISAVLSLISVVSYFIFNLESNEIKYLLIPLYSIYIIPSIVLLITYVKITKKNKADGVELINPSVLINIENVEVAFLDKVGSFTEEEMVVKKIYTDFELVNLENCNYNKEINLKRLVDILLICNNSTYNINEDTGKGSIEEIGYLRFAAKKGAYKSIINNKNKRKAEIPMDVDKRMLTVITKGRKGVRANCRGFVDEVLSKCKYIMINGVEKEITNEERDRIRAFDYNLSIDGLMTEGIAYRSFNYEPSQDENIESNLVFVGIVGSQNPLVLDYEERIEMLRENDIIPIVFTSSNKIAATAFGLETGLIKASNEVVSGVELDSLSKEELIEVLSKARIFCKVNSEVKRKITYLFAQDKYKILSLGEGFGDLPSLSLSTVGVLTGKTSNAIKGLGDVFIEKNILQNLFYLIKRGEVFNISLDNYFKIFSMLSLIQVVLMNTSYLYAGKSFDLNGIMVASSIFFVPAMVLALNGEFKKIKLGEMIISTVTIIGTVLFTAYLFNSEIYSLNVLSITIVFWTLINGKNLKEGRGVSLGIKGLMILVLVLSIILTSLSLGGIETFDILGLAAMILIFLIIECFVKKWILL